MAEQQLERAQVAADIVCVGFGPATAGFLTALTRGMTGGADPLPQVMCCERADDVSFGVSGIVTRGKWIAPAFEGRDLTAELASCAAVTDEKLLYLMDHGKASRRSWLLKIADMKIHALRKILPYRDHAFELPWIPPFMRKHGGMVMGMGELMQFAAGEVMNTGLAQIWPGTAVADVLPNASGCGVAGVRMVDQGVDSDGNPAPDGTFLQGMDVVAGLTVFGDGPTGAAGSALDKLVGMPAGNVRNEWALGMKMTVQLPEKCTLKPGTVWHTFGYPEPEIAGFFYVLPEGKASLGIIVPTWWHSPVRTAYRMMQHWMLHPAIWAQIQGGTMLSWGAKTLLESGRCGEPILCGDGFARIGEGSGTTNSLLNSGVDEAWRSGELLAQGVLELMREGKPYTKENLHRVYETRRRNDELDREAKQAAHARDGFTHGFVAGVVGMGLSGLTRGMLHVPGAQPPPHKVFPTVEHYFKGRIPPQELARLRHHSRATGEPLHEALMDYVGWPKIPYDGKLLVTHQDALLLGGKVRGATAAVADHVRPVSAQVCAKCTTPVCVTMCSGQALSPNPAPTGGAPLFDREKCVHCGACTWNCANQNLVFCAAPGGLHSAEN